MNTLAHYSNITGYFRPLHLRKSYQRTPFPIDGERGAAVIFASLGLPDNFGSPSDAACFRDENGKVRAITALYPDAGHIVQLLANPSVSSTRLKRLPGGMLTPRTLQGKMSWAARHFWDPGL